MKSCLASSTPATSSKVMPVLGSIWNLALDLPKARGLLPPGPPGPPWERLDSRNSPPTSSSGNARLPVAYKPPQVIPHFRSYAALSTCVQALQTWLGHLEDDSRLQRTSGLMSMRDQSSYDYLRLIIFQLDIAQVNHSHGTRARQLQECDARSSLGVAAL